MSNRRSVRVPAENRRRVSSVPPSTVISQVKFLTLSDNAHLLDDAISFGAAIEKTEDLSDQITTLNDALRVVVGLSIPLSDSFAGMSDAVALQVGFRLAVADSNALSDSIELGESYLLTLADNETLSDAFSMSELGHYQLTASDSNTLSDSLNRIDIGLQFSDGFTLTDSLTTFGQIFLTITGETINNWDEFMIPIPTGIGYAFERADAMSQDDAIQLFSAGFKTASDSFTLTDAYAQRANGLQTFSDALSQSDAFSMVEGEREVLSDNMGNLANGSVVRGSIWDVAVTGEQLSQSDAVSVALFPTLLTQSLSDSFTLTDACSTARGPSRWNDAISVSTSASTNLTRTLSDTLPSMADAIVAKTPRWKDAVSVVRANFFTTVPQSAADTLTSMADAVSNTRLQILRPISDISVGLWSATSLFQKIDEFTADDSDLILSATNPANDTCEVGLTTTASDPVSSTGHILSYRYAKSASTGRTIDLTVRLIQGTTILATFTHTNIGNTLTTTNQTLTGAQADSITNYGDLRIRFTANVSGSGAGRAANVYWAQFQCPK